MRVVLELAGIKNAFGKQLGSGNPLNNARATIEGLRAQRTVQQVAEERGLTVAELMGFKPGEALAVPLPCLEALCMTCMALCHEAKPLCASQQPSQPLNDTILCIPLCDHTSGFCVWTFLLV